ncbi:hypothetical protein [Bradyrhizobium sp. STM 3809]|uniref:hypothetical protein n=1 Tax=Bradyrhizobium sp. STM 3809 TaxID=551936 RepID=UPI00024092CF|nr:hypothetical protein [Bradyrhizobium sp. STM 3809]CCE00942.1 conserved exported hypothetical protein [Bradyrhizobium sp. STM 3809]
MVRWIQQGLLLTFLLPAWLPLSAGVAWAHDEADSRDSFDRAASYCRSISPRSTMTLSPDKRIMCFDAAMLPELDVTLTKALAPGGLFVIRSFGGREDKALELAELIRERHATVVVYDYCVSACAEFIFTAPDHTYVLKDALVLWHNPQSSDPAYPYCAFLKTPRDGGPKGLRRGECREGGDPVEYSSARRARFLWDRAIDPSSVTPPDSNYVRKRVASLYAETGVDRDILWTLHPRYYPRLFKANIVFEAYPQSQDEVDAAAARLGFKAKIIYDP